VLLKASQGFHAAVDGPISEAMGSDAVWRAVERLAGASIFQEIVAAMAIP